LFWLLFLIAGATHQQHLRAPKAPEDLVPDDLYASGPRLAEPRLVDWPRLDGPTNDAQSRDWRFPKVRTAAIASQLLALRTKRHSICKTESRHVNYNLQRILIYL
jgi:hypothetical protein